MTKGIGYIVESFVAILTLFTFAVGIQGVAQPQDWSSYRLRVEAQDMTEVTRSTSGLEMLERGETGTVRTFARHVSGGDLVVSGVVDIPVQEFSVGMPVLPDQQQVDDLRPVQAGDRCNNELDEIERDSGTQVLRPKGPDDDLHRGRLYVADTDPRIAAGGNGATDYDTLYVDNGTTCQFSPSEGPFYVDNYFRYSNGSAGAHFQFKNVTGSSGNRDLLYHNASQVLRLRAPTRRSMNGVETSVSFDTLKLSKASLPDYNLLVFRRDDSIQLLDNEKSRLEAFADRDGSLLLLMDLRSSDFASSSFLSSTQLDYVSDMSTSISGPPSFSGGEASRETKTFMKGVGGSISGVSLSPGGTVSSAPLQGTPEHPLVAYLDAYDRDGWNATDFSMSPNSSVVAGAPESSCYDDPDALTAGSFELPTTGGGTTTYDVINVELGASDSFCSNNDARALAIDFDSDGSFELSDGEGLFVEGDTVSSAGRDYNPFIPDSSTAQLLFSGSTDVEVVNYVESYRGSSLGRAGYEEKYSPADRKLLSAVVYQLLPENSVFGKADSAASLNALSGTNQSFYMPYTANLRWHRK